MERRKTRHSLALVYLGPSPVEEKDTRTREDTDDADGASGGRKAGKGRDGKDPEKVCGVSMAYVERGVVKPKRSLWRLSTITHFFWAIVNFIGVFFITMFSKNQMNTGKHQVLERNGMGDLEEVLVVVGVHMMVALVDPMEWQISVQMTTMHFLLVVHVAEVNTRSWISC
ncbi:hypothetical protein Taro_045058 [Colocasia esculenta]|uniref:Uncharacterized protein n=1 Tax=Colocasia esculenta TaxID=4460 RepID=A0A843X466_COLES|nr:hypothetical protein [Colocasia esculenta]